LPFRKFIPLCLVLAGLAALAATQDTPTTENVLAPESANEARLNRLQPPGRVMDAVGVVPGMAVAEIGAGRGRYAVQLAARVGEKGRVYAEDIDAKALTHLRSRCRRCGLRNVEPILGSVTDPDLPEGVLDLIFIISAYHHFEDPVALLRNARPALKPDGRLAIVEWTPQESGEEYPAPERVEAQMRSAGFALDRIETFLKSNNVLIYIFHLSDP